MRLRGFLAAVAALLAAGLLSACGGAPEERPAAAQATPPADTVPDEVATAPVSSRPRQSVARPAAVVATAAELQRCVDIWNRVNMTGFGPTGRATVSLGGNGCEVTVAYNLGEPGPPQYAFNCAQSLGYSYQCASHAHMPRADSDPKYWIWNAAITEAGRLTLDDPPSAPPLPLPKLPPYDFFDGQILPFGPDGEVLPGLTIVDTVKGTCEDGWNSDLPDSARCGWANYIHNACFSAPGPLEPGEVVLCSVRAGSTRFFGVEVQ